MTVTCITGNVRSGKTTLAVMIMREALDDDPDRPVITNIPTLVGTKLTSANAFTRGALIVLDEYGGFADSRVSSSGATRASARWVSIHGHYGQDMVIISHERTEIDKRIRSKMQYGIDLFGVYDMNFFLGADCYVYNPQLENVSDFFIPRASFEPFWPLMDSYARDPVSEDFIRKDLLGVIVSRQR